MLTKGQKVLVTAKMGTWYAVYDSKTGCVGCVSGSFIQLAPLTTSTPTPAPTTPKPTVTAPPVSGLSQDEQTLLNLVNKARADAKLGALATDPGLMKTSRLKAQDMVTNHYFDHQSPTYGSPFDMMKEFGITFKSAGENIAGNSTVDGAFTAWMGSPGHRANILNSSYNYTGIGIVPSPVYGKILVQQFIGR